MVGSAHFQRERNGALLRVHGVVCAKVLDTADIVRDAIFRQLQVLKGFVFLGIITGTRFGRRIRADSMPRSTIDFDTVRNIGLALPGVEESTAYGLPALKVQGKLLACVPANPSAEPGSIVVCVDFDDRAELLAAAPDVYYVTDHYLDDSAVLVRLSRVNPDVLRDLLGMAYKFVTANVVLRSPSRKRRNLGFRKR